MIKTFIKTNQFISSRRLYESSKRLIEVFITLALLVFTLPVLFIFSVLVKLESKGPAFYKQTRVGKNGHLFDILKLRSMRVDAEVNGPQWAQQEDPRVTRVGKFIRKTRIDELPQLINILRGDMSLIGPRPERPVFTELFSKDIPNFKARLLVKPGITGWAQVHGGYDKTPSEKLTLDLYYIERQSLYIDMKILFRTVKIVFSGEGAR